MCAFRQIKLCSGDGIDDDLLKKSILDDMRFVIYSFHDGKMF
jgi:hypothetical protein